MEGIICLVLAFFLGTDVAFQPEPRVTLARWGLQNSYKDLVLSALAFGLFLFLNYEVLVFGQTVFMVLEASFDSMKAFYGFFVFSLGLAFFQLSGLLALSHPLRKQNAGLPAKAYGMNSFKLVWQGLLSMGSTLWPYGLSLFFMSLLLTLPYHHQLTVWGRSLAMSFLLGFLVALWLQIDCGRWGEKLQQIYTLLSMRRSDRIWLGIILLEMVLLLLLIIE